MTIRVVRVHHSRELAARAAAIGSLVEQGGLRCELAPLDAEPVTSRGDHDLDLIVTDSLPALALARARCPNTPFVFAQRSPSDVIDDLVGLDGFEYDEVPAPLVLERFEVGELVRESFGRHAARAERQRQQLVLGGISKGAHVRADRESVRRILELLVCNALRSSTDGAIVTLGIDQTDHAVMVTTDVSDPSRAEVDRGFGLWLVKRLVEAQAGKVWGVTEPGRGARFSFTLPTPNANLTAVPPRPTVLVIEDDSSIRASIERVLTHACYRVVTAADGIAGLEVLRSDSVQLVILDLMMPRMNGLEFRELQCRDPFLATIPTVLITAFERMREGEPPLATDLCIQKPFRIRELLALVDQVVRTPPAIVFAG